MTQQVQAINPSKRLQLQGQERYKGASTLALPNIALKAGPAVRRRFPGLPKRCAPAMSRRSTRGAQPAAAAVGFCGAPAVHALGALGASFLATGQALKAIKCCEAACELQSLCGDQNLEARSRLALARLLLQHTTNLLAARKQLDRAVLLPRLSAHQKAVSCTLWQQ